MSKKFKGETCAYCSEADAETREHIFARKFFLVEDRGNLPEAPACKKCNGEKSKLEHYLASVLPFGGRHQQAMVNLQTAVPKRLAKNQKLHRELYGRRQVGWVKEGSSIYQPTGVVSFDGNKLAEFLKYIARGLTWYHWGKYLGPDHCSASCSCRICYRWTSKADCTV